MLTHQRAQTASLHRQRHQNCLLKQIKTVILLEQTPANSLQKFSQHHSTSKSVHIKKESRSNWLSSPLEQQLRDIEKIRGKRPKKKFSFKEDERNICQVGWAEFGEKVESETDQGLKTIRKKVKTLKKRATVGTICSKEGLKAKESREMLVGEEQLGDLWMLAKGGERREERYFRMSDLGREIKNSIVLSNAYKACLQSRNYVETKQEGFKDQKLKSYVYLKENQHKFPQKRVHELYCSNYLFP